MPSVLLIADESFARRERALLNRLEVGLADEGLRVMHAEPGADERNDDPGASLSERYIYERASPFVMTRTRAERFVEAMMVRAGNAGLPDVVHAWGDRCWGLAIETAGLIGAPLVLEVWASRLIPRLRRVERRAHRAGVAPLVWCVPSASMLREMDTHALTCPARMAHWGVYAPERQRPAPAPGAPRSIAILAADADADAIEATLEGIAMLTGLETPPLILLDELAVRKRPEVWERARALNVLDQVSVVAEMERQRELVLYADVLVQPECSGQIRSMTLDALAAGMVLVAQRDRASDTLAGETPAVLIDEPTPQQWAKAIKLALDDHKNEHSRARAGVRFVREQRKASRHVASLVQIYTDLLDQARLPG